MIDLSIFFYIDDPICAEELLLASNTAA